MNPFWIWLIVVLVLGVIISNLMVLKYSSKFKLPLKKGDKKQSPAEKKTDDKSS
ncbi:MAG: DUF2897 family protein [Pseudomonadota bacterium]